MNDARAHAVAEVERTVVELELATGHLRTAARHMGEAEIPRYAAHLLAAQGHMLTAGRITDDLTILHASRSHPLPEDQP